MAQEGYRPLAGRPRLVAAWEDYALPASELAQIFLLQNDGARGPARSFEMLQPIFEDPETQSELDSEAIPWTNHKRMINQP